MEKTLSNQKEQVRQNLSAKSRELDKSKKRLLELDTIFKKTFEQMALGTISEQQFKMLTSSYDDEK